MSKRKHRRHGGDTTPELDPRQLTLPFDGWDEDDEPRQRDLWAHLSRDLFADYVTDDEEVL